MESLTTADNRTMVPPLGCRLEVWQCMSGLLERYIRYVDTPQHFATYDNSNVQTETLTLY